MITIKEREGSVPFIRDMLVQSLTRAGMRPWQAHTVSKEVEDELLAKGADEVEGEEFNELVYQRLKNVNEKVAGRFKAWEELKEGERDPMIILIGGGTGVGTTTVGTEVAHRLGIRNIISTDSIRQIMRKMVSDKLLPALHASSYNVYQKMKVPVSKEKDAPLTGFKIQTSQVSIGIEAIIERALSEGTPALVEGLHVLPDFIDKELLKKDNIMMFMLTIKGEKNHKDRLYSRAFETKFKRSIDGYLENFKTIREIQRYIDRRATEEKVPIIENVDVEKTIVQIMDNVMDEMVKQKRKEESG